MKKLIILLIITSMILSGVYAADENEGALRFSAMKAQSITVDLNIELPIYFSNYTTDDEFTYRTAIFQDSLTQTVDVNAYYYDNDGTKIFGDVVSENGNNYVRFKVKPIKRAEYIFYISGNISSQKNFTINNTTGNLNDLPEDVKEYTQSTRFIQSDFSEIRTVANYLKTSDDPLENLVYVNNWVHSYIDYDLSYVSKVNDSITVLGDRKGVCDEFAILEASILRAQGYPVKYVVGYANTSQEWGAHAWLEVYVPGQGWISVDPTYNEVGLIDATHLVLEKLKDPSESKDSVTYTNNVNVIFGEKTQNFISTDIKSFEEQGHGTDVDISIVSAKEALQGSPHIAKLKLKNTTNNPITILVVSQLARDFTQLSPKAKKVVYYLKPLETKTVDYYFKLPILDNSYTYDFGFSSQFADKLEKLNLYQSRGTYLELFFSFDPIIYYKHNQFVFEEQLVNYTKVDKNVSYEFDYNGTKSYDSLLIPKDTETTYTKEFPKIENSSFSYSISGDYVSSKTVQIFSTIEKPIVFDENTDDISGLTDEDKNKAKLVDNVYSERVTTKSKTNYIMIGIVAAFILLIIGLWVSKSIRRMPKF